MLEETESAQLVSMEDRLKAIACQFIALYERWSEDRQFSAKQCFELEETIQRFKQQIDDFEKLEPQVRQHFIDSIDACLKATISKVSAEISQQTTHLAMDVIQKLATVTEKTEKTLLSCQRDRKQAEWKTIGISAFTTISICLLTLWLLIPKPPSSLSPLEMDYLKAGKITVSIWPMLSKNDKNKWIDLSLKVQHYNPIGIQTVPTFTQECTKSSTFE